MIRAIWAPNLCLLLSVLLAVSASAMPATAQTKQPEPLKRVGSMSCKVAKADTNGRTLEATELQCDLNLEGNDQPASADGRLLGRGFYKAFADEARANWAIYADVAELEPRDLTGDYDIESRFDYKFPDKREAVLVGGERDSIALVLEGNKGRDAIGPATRLTLQVTL